MRAPGWCCEHGGDEGNEKEDDEFHICSKNGDEKRKEERMPMGGEEWRGVGAEEIELNQIFGLVGNRVVVIVCKGTRRWEIFCNRRGRKEAFYAEGSYMPFE
jgi:hypothetical protein